MKVLLNYIFSSLPVVFFSFIQCVSTSAQDYVWDELKPGKHLAGFTTRVEKTHDGNPVLLTIWYPASSRGTPIKYADLLKLSRPFDDVSDSVKIEEHRNPISWMFGFELKNDEFMRIIDAPIRATRDASMTETYSVVFPSNFSSCLAASSLVVLTMPSL